MEDLYTATILATDYPETDAMGNQLGTVLGFLNGEWIVWDSTHGDACIEAFTNETAACREFDTRAADHAAFLVEIAAERDGSPVCNHDWLGRPESDTRECLICGTEVAG